ncbi:hypothetical protein Brms1b_005094 [Colletotrichum noveboracense]|nr:hypothetical protein Brms1b_005094 [Colletotrichum noveboracense]
MATAAKKEFLCILPDKPDALAKRLEIRPTHLAAAKSAASEGKVAVGGAMFESEHPSEGKTPAFKGSMIIYTVKDADEAWELIKNDVYAKNGVWDLEKAQVIPVSPLHAQEHILSFELMWLSSYSSCLQSAKDSND